jgi:cell division protein ZapA
MTSSKVTLTVGGRVYTIACDEGQEKRVQQIGVYIDQKLRDIIRSGIASNNESYQWLLVCMMLADELATARDLLDTAEMDTHQIDAKTQRQADIDLEAVRHLSHRIEELADKLKITE